MPEPNSAKNIQGFVWMRIVASPFLLLGLYGLASHNSGLGLSGFAVGGVLYAIGIYKSPRQTPAHRDKRHDPR